MRLLLDTHALIWWVAGDRNLTRTAEAAIGDGENEVFVSAVSAYEIALKHSMGRLPEAALLAQRFEAEAALEGFGILPITAREAQFAGRMDNAHRDPFDRMLIAQSLVDDMTIVSNERVFDAFGVARIW